MMGRKDARNNVEFYNRKQNGIISASGWLFKKKSITKHGNMNVKFMTILRNDFCSLPESA